MSESVSARLDAIEAEHRSSSKKAYVALREIGPDLQDLAEARRWMGLVLHWIGEEQKDWKDAASLLSEVTGRLNLHRDSVASARLAVACFLSGNVEGYLVAESEAAAAARDPTAIIVWIRLNCAEALLSTESSEVPRWLSAVLRLAQHLRDPTPLDGSLGATTNNVASSLLKMDLKNAANAEALELSAQASRTFWSRAGGWMQRERAEYLVALACNALGHFERAEAAARKGLSIIDENGDEPVDRAFLHVELALASKELGRSDEHAQSRTAATELASSFEDAALRQWFDRLYARIA